MKLYSYYSNEFAWMCRNIMVPSALFAGFDIHVESIGELSADTDSGGADWLRLNRMHIDLILRAIEANEGCEPLLICDSDVRFYGHVASDLRRCIGSHDLAFQCDWWGWGAKCMGFFAVRPSEKTWNFFVEVGKRLNTTNTDQSIVNDMFRDGCPGVDAVLLPKRYWTHGAETGVRYEPGMELNPPEDIKAHHANWVVGYNNKLRLLDEVYNKVMCLC